MRTRRFALTEGKIMTDEGTWGGDDAGQMSSSGTQDAQLGGARMSDGAEGVEPGMSDEEKSDERLEEQLPRTQSADEPAPGIP